MRQIKVEGFWGWLIAIGVFTLAAGIAVIAFTTFLVMLAVGILAAPFMRRRMRKRAARGKPGVIDVDYEVK